MPKTSKNDLLEQHWNHLCSPPFQEFFSYSCPQFSRLLSTCLFPLLSTAVHCHKVKLNDLNSTPCHHVRVLGRTLATLAFAMLTRPFNLGNAHCFASDSHAYERTRSQGPLMRAGRRHCAAAVRAVCVCASLYVVWRRRRKRCLYQ